MRPTAIHITIGNTVRETVHIIVVAIVALKFTVIPCIFKHGCLIRIRRLLCLCIDSILVQNTQQKAFPEHHIVPLVDTVFDLYQLVEV